jgi:hypothetical protein
MRYNQQHFFFFFYSPSIFPALFKLTVPEVDFIGWLAGALLAPVAGF